MFTVWYEPKVSNSLRYLFYMKQKDLEIPGQIYERLDPKPGQDKYFTSFGGKLSWEVGEHFTPFIYKHLGRDISFEIFYTIPQVMLKVLLDYEPSNVSKYKTGENRNCGNCIYSEFDRDGYDRYVNRSISERFESPPNHVYVCRSNGEFIDHRPFSNDDINRTARKFLDISRNSLRFNSCNGHTRSAYPKDDYNESGSPIFSRQWVKSEIRNRGLCNPESYFIRDGSNGTSIKYTVSIPSGIIYDIRRLE